MCILSGWFLHHHIISYRPSPRRNGLRATAGIAVLVGLSWGLGLWANAAYALDGVFPAAEAAYPAASNATRLDVFRSTTAWAAPFAIYVLWGASDALISILNFWLVGQLDESPRTLARFTGVVKALQAVGAATGWALSTYSWLPREDCGAGLGRLCAGAVPPSAQARINIVLAIASLPGCIWVCARLPDGHAAPRETVSDIAMSVGSSGAS